VDRPEPTGLLGSRIDCREICHHRAPKFLCTTTQTQNVIFTHCDNATSQYQRLCAPLRTIVTFCAVPIRFVSGGALMDSRGHWNPHGDMRCNVDAWTSSCRTLRRIKQRVHFHSVPFLVCTSSNQTIHAVSVHPSPVHSFTSQHHCECLGYGQAICGLAILGRWELWTRPA
jgi:hypothetical protein